VNTTIRCNGVVITIMPICHSFPPRSKFVSIFVCVVIFGVTSNIGMTVVFLLPDFMATTRTSPGFSFSRNQLNISYPQLQHCIDEYTSQGSWQGDTWTVQQPCGFTYWKTEDLPLLFQPFRVGFMGDSTTRSDIRAFEETFGCPRTDLDEMAVFQRRDENGTYVCQLSEQSMNLDKCGIPPILDISCNGANWRYFYKVYPWTPLDQWYLAQPELFNDIDVLVISLGRWFPYYEPIGSLDVTRDMDTFMVELKKVFSGTILYQSEYAIHHEKTAKLTQEQRVSCPHARCGDCGPWGTFDEVDDWECAATITMERPRSDWEIRSVVAHHDALYLDRWNISKSLPLEYFQLWYCRDGGRNSHLPLDHNQWDCNHHLYFVALQHLRLIATVMMQMLGVDRL
jgi:hypothetical protein